MVENEQFFRYCWLTMKQRRPRLNRLMTQIELEVAGLYSQTARMLDAKHTKQRGQIV